VTNVVAPAGASEIAERVSATANAENLAGEVRNT
jgi:hypothetical protein